QFEAGTLPEECFHHADHLRAAWLYLKRYPALEAVARFSGALKRYASSKGKPERYHETVTWAYLFLLKERMRRHESAASWEQFASDHAELLDWKNSILLKYYRAETLASDIARDGFVMPDR